MKIFLDRSRTMMDQVPKQVTGISIASASWSSQRSVNNFLLQYPSNESSKLRQRKAHSVIAKVNKLGDRMEGIREHVRLAPKLTKTVKGKLSLGARILQVGGVEKVFNNNFGTKDDEKLLKASQCYLSTTVGPIAGLLFVSTHKVAFCSERSIKFTSPTGKLLRVYYKVLIPLSKIKRANQSQDVKRPSQKYIQVVTEDNFEFWFMGFLNHQEALKYLEQAIFETQ
ncbi:GEM-like protein 7 [Coffea arabica]|nr:putative GEM-like protein 8 [Coffea arabica]